MQSPKRESESYEPACHYIGEPALPPASELISNPPQGWNEMEGELCH